MRFSQLSLIKYGHFEGCELNFPLDAADFHLIFGANEAGKSTTLAAVGDLLFGFPKSTSYDFRFDGPLLRLGARLEANGTELRIRRRKGNKETLLDETGRSGKALAAPNLSRGSNISYSRFPGR